MNPLNYMLLYVPGRSMSLSVEVNDQRPEDGSNIPSEHMSGAGPGVTHSYSMTHLASETEKVAS